MTSANQRAFRHLLQRRVPFVGRPGPSGDAGLAGRRVLRGRPRSLALLDRVRRRGARDGWRGCVGGVWTAGLLGYLLDFNKPGFAQELARKLDERWKAGSFRYLMPDFRERVHRGETFLIAGDRFAIGSSREMSPAGLKGVAEEAGLEMVVVAGNNPGEVELIRAEDLSQLAH